MSAGIEHEQADWLRAAFAGTAEEPPGYIVDPKKPTPNQRALSIAIGVSWCRLGKLRGASADAYLARAIAFYVTLAQNGHQAVTSAGYGDEQGAPAPHDALWWLWRATMLRETRLQGLAELYALAIRETGEELALCEAFWTPAGVRQPGSRAKGAAGMPLRPSWATCSWAYALITGASTAGLDKPDRGAIAILTDCRPAFAAIRWKASIPKLHIPVRKWLLPDGGSVSALAEDQPMNDRLSWVRVDAAGEIIGASDTLADLPDDLPTEPTIVLGGSLSGPQPEKPPAAPPTVPRDSSPVPALDAATRAGFAERLAGLGLGRRDQPTRLDLLRQLGGEMTPEQLRTAADRVAGFGIGAGQAQAPEWHKLIADMRVAGAA